MLKELRLCEVLFLSGMIVGCDASDRPIEVAEIQNIGLQGASMVPPLGEGVAPVIGRGGDGSPVVTTIGGWSGGPGAVKWHGGQWVMPYQATPRTTLQNVSCDVVPSATASDLIELVSSNGQVLGSSTVPATTANVVIRSWIVLSPGHPFVDGEQVVLRHSPRNVTSGAWTGAAEDMTIISCAVNSAAISTTRFISSLTGAVVMAGSPIANGPDGMRMQSATDQFYLGIPLGATETLVHVRGKVKIGHGAKLHMEIRAYDPDAFSGSGNQTLLGGSDSTTTNGLNENLDVAFSFQPSPSGPRFVSVLFRVLSFDAENSFVSGIEVGTN